LFIAACSLLLLPFYFPRDVSVLLSIVGRFHPVILHFPIVLIVLSLVLEIMRRSGMLRKADFMVSVILVAAALSALLAIGSGYLLYVSGEYSGNLISQHFWTGVITGSFILSAAGFFILYRRTKKFYSLYMASLIISNGAVAFASHLGGSVTHGEDYLTEYVPLLFSRNDEAEVRHDSAMLLYEDVLMPVFEAKCVSCHNDARSKGDYNMKSYDHLLKGGESGDSAIVPLNADSSELYVRIMLPEGHPDRMPPEGKAPLTTGEQVLLAQWIRMGAKKEMGVKEITTDKLANASLEEVLPSLKRYRRVQELTRQRTAALKEELARLAMELNVEIEPDSLADEGMYVLSMKFPPAAFSTMHVKRLEPYAEIFSRVSLVSSGVNDEALYTIGKMKNLEGLYLQKTRINGSGIVHLQKLEKLETLNISYTEVDDKALLDVLKIPALREVFVFRTKATPQVISALQQYRPSLQVLAEEGPYK
jgi:uncharacterized membrane protein